MPAKPLFSDVTPPHNSGAYAESTGEVTALYRVRPGALFRRLV